VAVHGPLDWRVHADSPLALSFSAPFAVARAAAGGAKSVSCVGPGLDGARPVVRSIAAVWALPLERIRPYKEDLARSPVEAKVT
jgi:hypothetical protein